MNPPRAVTLAVEVPLPEAPLRMQLQVSSGPVPPRRLLPVLRAVADQLVAQATAAAAAQGRTPSCGPGCAACCSYLVPVSRAEAQRLLAVVQAMPPERQQLLAQRHQHTLQRLEAAGVLDELQHPERSSEQDLAPLSDRYHAAGAPCPFLEADGRCGVYAERPLTCREHLALSPPERCARDDVPGEQGLRLLRLAAYPSRAANALDDGPAMEQGGWVALPLALAYAAAHPEGPPSAPAPELMGRFFDTLLAQAQGGG